MVFRRRTTSSQLVQVSDFGARIAGYRATRVSGTSSYDHNHFAYQDPNGTPITLHKVSYLRGQVRAWLRSVELNPITHVISLTPLAALTLYPDIVTFKPPQTTKDARGYILIQQIVGLPVADLSGLGLTIRVDPRQQEDYRLVRIK